MRRATVKPLAREVDEKRVDRLLRDLVEFRELADVDPPHGGRDQRHDLGADEPVMHHDIGRLHHAQRLDRQKIGIARTGANQEDVAWNLPVGMIFHGVSVRLA